MTQRQLIEQWVAEHTPREVADVLVMTKANQVAVLRAYAAGLKAEADSALASFDARHAAAKADAQAEAATLSGII